MGENSGFEVRRNEWGQPIGFAVTGWREPSFPSRDPMEGRWCRLSALQESDAEELFEAFRRDRERRCWTYLAYGPFETLNDYRDFLQARCLGNDPLFYGIRNKETGRLGGVASYLRIKPVMGSIEVGHLCFAPELQRTRAATESMFLMMKHAFDLGYRRYEWKCDHCNEASGRAAERFGFRFEGTFRQAMMYKGRNRDTDWFAIVDRDWPEVRRRFEAWLAPGNFDESGRQKTSLSQC